MMSGKTKAELVEENESLTRIVEELEHEATRLRDTDVGRALADELDRAHRAIDGVVFDRDFLRELLLAQATGMRLDEGQAP